VTFQQYAENTCPWLLALCLHVLPEPQPETMPQMAKEGLLQLQSQATVYASLGTPGYKALSSYQLWQRPAAAAASRGLATALPSDTAGLAVHLNLEEKHEQEHMKGWRAQARAPHVPAAARVGLL
jgi:hypothetical protein